MKELYLTKLCDVACDVHIRAADAKMWFYHQAAHFDEMSSKEQARTEMKALALWKAFEEALAIIEKAIPNIREEKNNGGTNTDT